MRLPHEELVARDHVPPHGLLERPMKHGVRVLDGPLHGLADPNYFATSRAACLAVYLTNPPCYLDEGFSGALALAIWVFVPLTMAVLASWLTGRRVARWYATRLSQS